MWGTTWDYGDASQYEKRQGSKLTKKFKKIVGYDKNIFIELHERFAKWKDEEGNMGYEAGLQKLQEGVPPPAMPCQCGDDCACGGTCGGNCGIEGCNCKPLAPAPPAACACGPDCAACSVSPGGPLGVGLRAKVDWDE